jgi:lipopolysaccharide assembly protein A
VPFTKLSGTWLGGCAISITSIILIIFLLENGRSVEVRFLWLNGKLPLAVALLIAGTGVAVVATVIGTARIAQLGRLAPAEPTNSAVDPTSSLA